MTDLHRTLAQVTGLEIYPPSIQPSPGGATCFLGRRGRQKLLGCVGGQIAGKPAGQALGRPVLVGPASPENARFVRAVLPWTAPRPIGLVASVGLGDRLGLATPGHIRAARDSGLGLVLAQQSVREMTRTGRSAQEVLDAATWGVLQEGYQGGFGADADHLLRPADIDATLAAGFTMFTIDPGQFVADAADAMDDDALAKALAAMDMAGLETTAGDLARRYVDRIFPLEGGGQIEFAAGGRAEFPAGGQAEFAGGRVEFDRRTFARAIVKYGRAVAHAAAMFRHLSARASGPFELEVSVDETAGATSPAEHYFIAAELRRLGVRWVSLAPRLAGRFEKGVDYIGDLDEFRRHFAAHVRVMRTLGPYKISLHSGSDKFSIYPVVAELAGGLVHLKTAGTSYLEALRAVARIDPDLFRQILDFARSRYQRDQATYCVSADPARVPPAAGLDDADLEALLDDFHTRQVLHVTFGSVLTAEEGRRFRAPLLADLLDHEEVYYDLLRHHLGRHVAPFA